MSYHLESTSDIRVAQAYSELQHAYYSNRGRLIIAGVCAIIAVALFVKLSPTPIHWVAAVGSLLLFVRSFFAHKNIRRLRERYWGLRTSELGQGTPDA